MLVLLPFIVAEETYLRKINKSRYYERNCVKSTKVLNFSKEIAKEIKLSINNINRNEIVSNKLCIPYSLLYAAYIFSRLDIIRKHRVDLTFY